MVQILGVEKIEPMLCKDGDIDALDLSKYICQYKYDGTRVFVFKTGDDVKIIGARSWKNDFAALYPEIVRELRRVAPPNVVLDGELTYFDREGKDHFLTALATPNERQKRELTPALIVFDVLNIMGRDVRALSVEDRYQLVLRMFGQGAIHLPGTGAGIDRAVHVAASWDRPTDIQHDYKELFKFITNGSGYGQVGLGGEGMVLKRRGAPYACGSRHYCIKIKKEVTEDCVVIGITKGKDSRSGLFGSLVLGQYGKDGELHYVGKAGTGFNLATLSHLLDRILHIPESEYPIIKSYLPTGEVQRWVLPNLVVEVKFLEKTDDGKMRFPAFLRVRDDKPAKECMIK